VLAALVLAALVLAVQVQRPGLLAAALQ